MGGKYIKYIIEIPEDKVQDFVGTTHLLMPYSMAGHIGHHDTGLPITPYTEPDLGQVRKKAYKIGYEKGYRDGVNRIGDAEDKIRKEAYAEGFKDGQYAERNGLVANYAQVHKIKIGDEVIAEHGGSTFTVTWMSDVCICGIDSDGRCYSYEINEVDGKTGNHHDIATVLEKMRGEQDG